MKTFLAFLLAVVILGSASAQSIALSLMPQPVSMEIGDGHFNLPNPLRIHTGNSPELKSIGDRLAKQIGTNAIILTHVEASTSTPENGILLALNSPAISTLGKEGYSLEVNAQGITLRANTAAGIFYGVQTLLQLLPPGFERSVNPDQAVVTWSIPAVSITDYPRFAWRGIMLDVSRHFFTKQEVKDFIDEMVKYKFNLLHWHLTDDQGWRIEIKSLPKLTSVGAWRVDKTGTFNTFSDPLPDEPRTYGGFYTQDDIREIVKYAAERYVDILPEVDVPGHSLAAIAAYPDLTSTPGTYAVNSGEKFMVWPPSGHFYGLIDNALCPAKEGVYDFLDKVFTEVASLFPFPYIHMGGDETARNFWEKSDLIAALMKKEKLKNLDEVQSYFVKRVEKIVESKKKKLIGWDEILQGGLAPNAAVMSWRGMNGGIEAAKQGHEVVMTPTTFVYLDYMQGDALMEPPVYASLRLKKTYEFEPVPPGIDAKLIKGGQANMWTEQIYNTRHLQYMLWPRAFAVAEVLWSPKEKRNWNDFVPRVERQFPRLDAANIKYSPAMYDPGFKVERKDSSFVVTMTTEVDGLDIYYSFDNSFPDQYYPKYAAPVMIPKDAATMKVITYRNGQPIGRLMVMPKAEWLRRAK